MNDSMESFFKKKEDLMNRDNNIEPYVFNKTAYKNKNNIRIYKKHIPLNLNKNSLNINKNTRYKDDNNLKRPNSTNRRNFNFNSQDLENVFYFRKNFNNNSEEKQVNNGFHAPQSTKNSLKKKIYRFQNYN